MEELVVYFLIGLNIILLGWLVFLSLKLKELIRKGNVLFSEEPPGNLRETIDKYFKSIKAVEDHCFVLDKEQKRINDMASASLHKVGFIRYNPFGDVGGNQSFSLSLLDEKNNGFVISSIHSREGTRVYSKAVTGGDSNFNLSAEEKQAIEAARKK